MMMLPARSWVLRGRGPGGPCCCRTCWPPQPPAWTPPTADDTAVSDDASWLLDRAGTYLQVHARLN